MRKILFFFFILAGILLSAPSLYKRIKLEFSSRNVEIMSEYGSPQTDVRILQEYTLAEWVQKSWAGRWSPSLPCPFKDSDKDSVILIFAEDRLFRQARKVFELKLGHPVDVSYYKGNYYLKIDRPGWNELEEMGMGIVNETGGKSYIRPLNDNWVNPGYIDWFYKNISTAGVIFRGDQVMGFPDQLKYVNRQLIEKNIKVFAVEFFRQDGFREVSRGLEVVRLHSIPPELSVDKAVQSCLRGVKERNIRALYFKSRKHIENIRLIREELESRGFRVAGPHGFENVSTRNYFAMVGMVLVLFGIGSLVSNGSLWVLYAALLAVAGVFLFPSLFLHFLCFGCAVGMPVAAVKVVSGKGVGFVRGICVFFLLSLLGGILISSATAVPSFYAKLEQLRGIKIALIVPVILSFFVLYGDSRDKFNRSIKWMEAGFVAFGVLLVIIYILRSSNFYPELVTNTEVRIRLFLEEIFIYRPRFKEFLIGHPFLIAGLYFLKRRTVEFKYSKIMIMIGLVGQISILNTFMHSHSPFMVGIIRTFWSALLGAILGAVLIFIIKWADLKE